MRSCPHTNPTLRHSCRQIASYRCLLVHYQTGLASWQTDDIVSVIDCMCLCCLCSMCVRMHACVRVCVRVCFTHNVWSMDLQTLYVTQHSKRPMSLYSSMCLLRDVTTNLTRHRAINTLLEYITSIKASESIKIVALYKVIRAIRNFVFYHHKRITHQVCDLKPV